jgi:hypothetical protein
MTKGARDQSSPAHALADAPAHTAAGAAGVGLNPVSVGFDAVSVTLGPVSVSLDAVSFSFGPVSSSLDPVSFSFDSNFYFHENPGLSGRRFVLIMFSSERQAWKGGNENSNFWKSQLG